MNKRELTKIVTSKSDVKIDQANVNRIYCKNVKL